MSAGVIDQDMAHRLRRDTEEMGAVLPFDLALVDEPEVCLADERRRLQWVAGRFAPHVAASHLPQAFIDHRHQVIERVAPAIAPRDQ